MQIVKTSSFLSSDKAKKQKKSLFLSLSLFLYLCVCISMCWKKQKADFIL